MLTFTAFDHVPAAPACWRCPSRRIGLFASRCLDAESALLSGRSDRARTRIAGRLEGGALRSVADVRAGATTCSSRPATSRAACARRTSTRSTRCRTRAGSPTASAPGRSRTTSSCAARIVGAPPDPSKWVLIREKTVGRAPRLHGDGCQGRDMVPRVRSAVSSRKAPPPPSRLRPRFSGRSATTRSSRS